MSIREVEIYRLCEDGIDTQDNRKTIFRKDVNIGGYNCMKNHGFSAFAKSEKVQIV